MKKVMLLSLLVSCCLCSFARSDYFEGFIINQTGDTLKGEVEISKRPFNRGYNLDDVHLYVEFREQGGKTKKYKPDDLKGYGFKMDDAWQRFTSYEVDRTGNGIANMSKKKQKRFVRILADNGPITFYYYSFWQNTSNSSINHNWYYFVKNGEQVAGFNRDFLENGRKKLIELFADCPQAVSMIKRAEMQSGEIAEAVIKYNNCK